MFSEYCTITAISCSFEFVVVWVWVWVMWVVVVFPAITLSQPNYSYGCFVVRVVVVVGLWQYNLSYENRFPFISTCFNDRIILLVWSWNLNMKHNTITMPSKIFDECLLAQSSKAVYPSITSFAYCRLKMIESHTLFNWQLNWNRIKINTNIILIGLIRDDNKNECWW